MANKLLLSRDILFISGFGGIILFQNLELKYFLSSPQQTISMTMISDNMKYFVAANSKKEMKVFLWRRVPDPIVKNFPPVKSITVSPTEKYFTIQTPSQFKLYNEKFYPVCDKLDLPRRPMVHSFSKSGSVFVFAATKSLFKGYQLKANKDHTKLFEITFEKAKDFKEMLVNLRAQEVYFTETGRLYINSYDGKHIMKTTSHI